MKIQLPNLSNLLLFLEKVAAYYGIGGVGVANYPHLSPTVRAVLAALSSALVIVDRTAFAPTVASPTKQGAPPPPVA